MTWTCKKKRNWKKIEEDLAREINRKTPSWETVDEMVKLSKGRPEKV